MRLIIVLSLLLGLPSQDGAQELDQVLEKEAPACVLVRGEARYQGLGYTHYAIVKNGCAAALACELYSDVDRETRHRVTVAAGETHEEPLRRGSPASAFRVGYRCVMR